MITKAEALTGQYSADGSPWVQVAVQAGIDVDTLEYSADGSPWYGLEEPTAAGNVKTWNGVAIANIKTINGVAIANIKTINGISL